MSVEAGLQLSESEWWLVSKEGLTAATGGSSSAAAAEIREGIRRLAITDRPSERQEAISISALPEGTALVLAPDGVVRGLVCTVTARPQPSLDAPPVVLALGDRVRAAVPLRRRAPTPAPARRVRFQEEASKQSSSEEASEQSSSEASEQSSSEDSTPGSQWAGGRAAATAPPASARSAGHALGLAPAAEEPSLERLQRARVAGKGAREKLAGRARVVPRTPDLDVAGPKGFFAVVRAAPGIAEFGLIWGSYTKAVAGYVEQKGRLAQSVIFHGFHSPEEAKEYFRAARPGEPFMWLPPRGRRQ